MTACAAMRPKSALERGLLREEADRYMLDRVLQPLRYRQAALERLLDSELASREVCRVRPSTASSTHWCRTQLAAACCAVPGSNCQIAETLKEAKALLNLLVV